jgi:HEAT repeat protein
MPKPPPLEIQLLELSALRGDAKSALAREKLTHALTGKSNLLTARAATILADTQQADFLPLLEVAFDRYFKAANDKGCAAKTAIANALYTLGHSDSAAFLRGIRHKQMEPSFGGPVDCAAELRGTCALGLVRAGYRDVLLELPALLMDREPQTRQIAVRALIYANDERGTLLLRMKILAGDENSDVIAEALAGLMKLSPGKSLEFVAQFLEDKDSATAESAAIAIGGARSLAAFELLRAQWERHIRPEPRTSLLLGMTMTRQPAAIEFLLQRVHEDSPRPAVDAIVALAIYKHDDAVKAKVAAAVQSREDSTITQAFKKAFSVT